MARYRESDYSLDLALQNIGEYFFSLYHSDLKEYAQQPNRLDIVQKIHVEWDKTHNLSSVGTDIRIEWAVAIYNHGDWNNALARKSHTYNCQTNCQAADPIYTDSRKKHPAVFRCDNGVYVRSLSELFIADWFYANKIQFEYEREVFFSSCQKYVHCDFYLPAYDVYIEFWGMEQVDQYLKYKAWKEPLYHNNGYRLISLYFDDLKSFRDVFTRKLKASKQK